MRTSLMTCVLVLAAGCGGRAPGGAAPGPAAVGNLPAAAPAADPARDDRAFQTLARAVASQSARQVMAWGTAPLAEDATPRRWAMLVPDDMNDGRGAYLLEAAPGKAWLVTFYVDGRTQAWRDLGPASGPTWETATDRAITHAQGHHHGGGTTRFALRGDAPAVLAHEHVEDVEADDGVSQSFAEGDVCTPTCPPLRGFDSHGADLQVSGPGAEPAALLGGP